jgi:5-(carboxyamino)imidazole ribonucleotide synthase
MACRMPTSPPSTMSTTCARPRQAFPGILKVARFGYDGKGQAVVANRDAAIAAFQHFKGETCVLEQKLALDCEVSVVLARDETGRSRAFRPPRTATARASSTSRWCRRVSAELRARPPTRRQDRRSASAISAPWRSSSSSCDGELVINEMAPRPHNSGHYTIDACITSQYEQQVRALCGLPLGEARAHSAAAMVNLLGDLWYETGPAGDSLPRAGLVEAARLSRPQAASLWQASRPARPQDGALHGAR